MAFSRPLPAVRSLVKMLAPVYAGFDLVVIGASLGGLRTLAEVLEPLPADFPAPILIAQHLHDGQPGTALPELLGGHTRLSVTLAADGAALRAGTVYVAPPGRHLTVTRLFTCAVREGPRVNHACPAVDPLFQSAAEVCGARTLAVVLTGRLYDGSAGAVAVRRAGGVVLAQEPATCVAPGMPAAAIRTGSVHLVLPPATLACALIGLVMVPGTSAAFGVPGRAA